MLSSKLCPDFVLSSLLSNRLFFCFSFAMSLGEVETAIDLFAKLPAHCQIYNKYPGSTLEVYRNV